MKNKVFFIGGPGTISTTTIQEISDRGDSVGLFTHPSSLSKPLDPRIKIYPGDRNDTPALAAALDDFKPDIVLDFVCFTPHQAEALVPLIKGKAAQFIFVSTVDVYGYPLKHIPFRESDPWNEPVGDYAANKVLCEQVFKKSGAPLTIVRPTYSFGPEFVLTAMSHAGGFSMITRLRNQIPVLVPGDGTTLMHVSAAPNTGRVIACTVGSSQSLNTDYTVGQPTYMTQDEYIQLFAGVLGVEAKIVHIPTEVILSFDDPATENSLLHTLTRFNVAFSVEKFSSHFPDFEQLVTLEEWARYYIEENDRRGTFPPPEEVIFDDRLIAAWYRATAGMRLE
jgi:nucleoside-diphosphate-sugar epimerase